MNKRFSEFRVKNFLTNFCIYSNLINFFIHKPQKIINDFLIPCFPQEFNAIV